MSVWRLACERSKHPRVIYPALRGIWHASMLPPLSNTHPAGVAQGAWHSPFQTPPPYSFLYFFYIPDLSTQVEEIRTLEMLVGAKRSKWTVAKDDADDLSTRHHYKSVTDLISGRYSRRLPVLVCKHTGSLALEHYYLCICETSASSPKQVLTLAYHHHQEH